MMKVMIVDDEPYIAQGLSILIDWKEENCEIVQIALSGADALSYVKRNPVDLILLDMQMPEMNGVEFLKNLRELQIVDTKVLILSGFTDFYFAQSAIRYRCEGYLLKPIQKEQLVEQLRKLQADFEATRQEAKAYQRLQDGYLAQSIGNLLRKRHTAEELSYVREQLHIRGAVRFASININLREGLEELGDYEVYELQQSLYNHCCSFLGLNQVCCRKLMRSEADGYEVAILYHDALGEEKGLSVEMYFRELVTYLRYHIHRNLVVFVGKKVDSLEKLSFSYVSSINLKATQSMLEPKEVYYYEKDMQIGDSKVVLCKKSLDALLAAIQSHNEIEIGLCVNDLFREMELVGNSKKITAMNINYLMFQLTHMAVEIDETIRQEEIINYIGSMTVDAATDPRNRVHMKRFAIEFSDYLGQLQKHHSVGVLAQIEKEIQQNYAQNLTLRDLGKKYFINSSYLGQMFRKKHGKSFKDYLTVYRIEEAASLLSRTERKIADIAEEVGYRDIDYFITRFIELKGCTPARYRRQHQSR